MATGLLKRRIRDTRVLALGVIALLFLSEPLWGVDSHAHEPIEYLGYALVIICVVGRIWCSTYIGGYKNERVVDIGPFSMVRNPLYVFSFLGVVGIGLMSARLSLVAILAVAFAAYYYRVVRREEFFLREKFGPAYDAYCRAVPRWFPRFRNYRTDNEVITRPQFVLRTIRDSVWFFAALPAIEAIEYFQVVGWLRPLFWLP
ncbi:MAG: isoprenylcysteine carboxylmethyltransferase family protein [Alphaproteobacteria bacterium]|nr:isoprenylcysteine carboxylmethyltransferase family protein [Alphaproteobacteria bacterium]